MVSASSKNIHLHAERIALRMDFAALTGNSAVTNVIAFLAPLAFTAFTWQSGPDESGLPLTVMAYLTVMYWVASIAVLFQFNSDNQLASARMIGVMPVSRCTQVNMRYCSAGVLFLICFAELGIEIALSRLWFGIGLSALATVVPLAMFAFLVLAAIVIPVFYSCGDFVKAYSRLFTGAITLFFAAQIILLLLPAGLRSQVLATSITLSPIGWIVIAVIAILSLIVSYRISLRIWSAKEL
ncbi:ABC-2 transporter permease [Bifidobacterium imperatoris]|uniref:ABC-2 family transporter protein n=1 Tax=Bifidobacterium imperatoris TaxID=2020965 RepID=A0A2N5IUF3_9BIFI|nr:ABC-2 transporter permease [Bifidobacterium imperatoris]PLS25581.1 ABC-2 family transporter protein [Bifidobacterium imperatoris]QSY57143.1 ABC-2 transporter permease [Bifidobacterium imperatoris]